jgi:hypothetical protein
VLGTEDGMKFCPTWGRESQHLIDDIWHQWIRSASPRFFFFFLLHLIYKCSFIWQFIVDHNHLNAYFSHDLELKNNIQIIKMNTEVNLPSYDKLQGHRDKPPTAILDIFTYRQTNTWAEVISNFGFCFLNYF